MSVTQEETTELLQRNRSAFKMPTIDEDTSGKMNPNQVKFAQKIQAIREAIESKGFVAGHGMTLKVRQLITDPMRFDKPLHRFYFGGVNSTRGKGGIKFSGVDFFGEQLHESWYVYDDERFRAFFSKRLETLFHLKNPKPADGLKASFTHLMHTMNLHWSGCSETPEARAASAKRFQKAHKKEATLLIPRVLTDKLDKIVETSDLGYRTRKELILTIIREYLAN